VGWITTFRSDESQLEIRNRDTLITGARRRGAAMDRATSGSRTALLVLDIIPVVVPAFGGDDDMLEQLRRATEAARDAKIPVIYVRVAFRPGYPDVSDSNALFGPLRDMLDFTETDADTGVHASVAPKDGDIVVTKRRVSAFAGSDLDVVLRSLRVDRLVLAGVATSGVVLSTVRQAADLDFELTVLSDGCGDGDPEVHRVLMEKVFPTQATVATTEEWITELKAAGA
jgi:nicotinamidase-related amidase